MCLHCEQRRDALLTEAEDGVAVRFEDWKWRVAYRNPKAEEDAWKHWGDRDGDVLGCGGGNGKGKRNLGLLRVGFSGGA